MFERPSAEMLFPAAAQCYLNSRMLAVPGGRVRKLSPRTLRDYEQYAAALSRLFHNKKLSEITIPLINCYQVFRAYGYEVDENYEQVKDGVVWDKPCQAQRIKNEVTFLRALKKKARCWTQDDEEDFEQVHVEEPDFPRVPDPDEQALWLEKAYTGPEADPSRWLIVYGFSMIEIHCCTGHQETRMIRLEDINLFSKTLTIKNRSAKNKYRARTIPLSPEAQAAMKVLMDRATSLGSVLPHHALFPFRDPKANAYIPEKCMTVSGIKKLWREVQDATEMRWFTPNHGRHTGITRHAENGTALQVCMAMAGHMSRKMQDRYTAICEAAKQKAVLKTFPGKKTAQRVPMEGEQKKLLTEKFN